MEPSTENKPYEKAMRLLFTAVLVFSFTGIVEPLTNLLAHIQGGANFILSWSPLSTGNSLQNIGRFINIAVMAGLASFAYALWGWKKFLEEDAAKAVNIIIVGAALCCLNGLISGPTFNILGYIAFVIGYVKLKNTGFLSDKDQKGAGTLVSGSVVMLVGLGFYTAFPLVGRVLYFFIAFASYAMTIMGWKKITSHRS